MQIDYQQMFGHVLPLKKDVYNSARYNTTV